MFRQRFALGPARICFTAPFFALCLLVSLPLHAEPASSAERTGSQNSETFNVGDDATRLEVDTQGKRIRVMIDGKEIAVFDHLGLHVTGDVEFTGGMTDTVGETGPPPVWLKHAE